MPSVLGEAWVEISAPSRKLAQDLARAESMVGRSSVSMAAKMARMGETFSRVGRKLTMGVTLPIMGYMAVAVKAAMEQEKASAALKAALEKQGAYTKEIQSDLEKYASTLQKQTVYGDEATIQTMAFGLGLGLTTDKLKEATKSAMGLASVYHIPLDNAMRILALGSQGVFLRLKQMGIAVDETKSETEVFNEILEKGREGFKLTQAEAKTTEGQFRQLMNAVGDFNETIGGKLLPQLKKLVGLLGKIVTFMEKVPKGFILTGLAIAALAMPIMQIVGAFLMWRSAAAAAAAASAAAAAAGAGAVGGIGAKAAAAAAGGGLAYTVGRKLGWGLGAAGGAAARVGAAAATPSFAIPAAVLTILTGLAVAGVSMLKSRRIAYEAGQPAQLPKDYVKGAIRMREPGMGGLEKQDIERIHRELRQISENTKNNRSRYQ